MQFILTEPQTEFEALIGGHFYINAFGRIESQDGREFRDFLIRTAPPPRLNVYIDSPGGDVEAAIEIGRLVRDHWFSTSIGSYILEPESVPSVIAPRRRVSGQCMSTATLMFLGGRLRHFSEGSTFGVHQFSFQNPSPDDVRRSQVLSAKIARFVADMGVSPEFLELSSAATSSEIRPVDEETLRALGVLTGYSTNAVWTVQARNGIMYVRGERDSTFGHHKVMLCYAKGAGFMFWAVIEAQGRENELINFGLVEIVVNGEDVRIDISETSVRSINGMYVNVVSKITEDQAKLLAYSKSFGIQVRFSGEAELFFGIDAISTDGGADQLETFFNTFSIQKT